jgi:tetratricopeptide (TPR) repeat protein
MRPALILALCLAGMPASAAETRPDETALRYYAAQRQTERVAAETERLSRRFPGWTPPADLWTAEPGAEDEEGLWDLLAAGRLDALRKALGERARAEPGWRPSGALAGALARRQLREEVRGLVKAGRWPDLASLADRRRPEIEAGEAEVAWGAAEALARTDRAPEAIALFARVLAAPGASADDRRAGLLRALPLLPMAEIDRLGAKIPPDDLAPIRIDLIRARLSAVLHDEAGQAVAPADVAAFQAYAEAAPDPNQPALVAWYAFKRSDLPEALSWFKRAIARGGDAMVAHGLAHTLLRLGLRREAEDVSYAWREPLVNNSLLFIDILERDLTRATPPAIEPERLRRYAEVTAATASGEGAQALAWYATNTCQFDAALAWFRRAVAWFPKEATVYGYALALQRAGQQRAFVELVNRYDGLFPRVVGLLFAARSERSSPCDAPASRPAEPVARTAHLDLGFRPEAAKEAAKAEVRGRVPQPDALEAPAAPLVRRSDFPVAVAPENELRAAPTGSPLAVPGPASSRAAGRLPTTARRVPGVGPMPYERYGFSLLPAWTGATGPSVPSAAERPAPLGSLWSAMQAVPADPPASRDVATTGAILPKPRKPLP